MQRRTALSALALAAVGGGGWFFSRPSLSDDPLLGAALSQTSDDVDISGVIEMSIGAEDASVVLTEYASFTCPHCRNFHETVLPSVKAQFIDTGLVRMVYREVYFDRPGLWASMVARCAGTPEKFFGIANLIYSKQSEWTQADGPGIANNLRTIGLTAGLDADALDACMVDADAAQALVAWFNTNKEADQISSTPTFLINGEKLEGNWGSNLIPALTAATGA